MPRQKTPKTPEGVTRPEAVALWRKTFQQYDLDASGIELLRVAVRSLDCYLKLMLRLEEDGPVFQTKSGQFKKNPLHELIRHERAGFISAVRLLDLEPEPTEKKRVGRPGVYGY